MFCRRLLFCKQIRGKVELRKPEPSIRFVDREIQEILSIHTEAGRGLFRVFTTIHRSRHFPCSIISI